MFSTLRDVCCASLPLPSLESLAEVRDRDGVTVAVVGDRAWVRFAAGDEEVLPRLLPVSAVALYVRRDGRWYGYGCHLPAFDVPENADYRPLSAVLTPVPVRPESPPPLSPCPLLLTLVPDARPRPTTALRCPAKELVRWAGEVPAVRLTALQAARSGEQVLLLGTQLPSLLQGQRYWGREVLIPLGYRLEPDLPAGAVREALGIDAEELLLLGVHDAEVIPTAAFRPLSRVRARLAAGEVRA